MKGGRVTQKQVADAAGVHRTTVSLALKNHPGIPPATRDRVRRIAESLGYAPDPMLMALTTYRTSRRPSAFRGMLAWLTNWSGKGTWRLPHCVEIYEGARARARELGYELEPVDLRAKGMSPRRVESILRTKNIQGLILCPQRTPTEIVDFAWEHFSAVMIGHSLLKPQFHTVVSMQYHAMLTVLRQARARGYRRIGLVLNPDQDVKADRLFLAGFLVEHFQSAGLKLLPPFFTVQGGVPDPAAFMAWREKHRPDAIVTGNARLLEFLADRGLRAPADLGVACVALPRPQGDMAGVYESFTEVGRVATDQIAAMIARGEKGVPATPLRIGVEGQWHEGGSLRSSLVGRE